MIKKTLGKISHVGLIFTTVWGMSNLYGHNDDHTILVFRIGVITMVVTQVIGYFIEWIEYRKNKKRKSRH